MIPWYKPHFWGKEIELVTNALESTWISDGEYITRFESTMSEILGSRHVVTTSNGTSSLMLAYLSLGIGSGDEVIVPGFTFAAPANMALALGAKPVFADVCPETWLLCPKSLEQKVTTNTKAIVPVHIYGNVCNMDEILKIAQERKLFVIEDVAEAAFSTYNGRQAGTLGDIGSFSFQATKTITMGEGGAICTDSDQLQDSARVIRNHGVRQGKRYWHEVVGHNFRLTNMQAAMGCAQLEYLEEILENKKRVSDRYRKNLSKQPGLVLQQITPGCDPVVWATVVKIDEQKLGISRDELIEKMKDRNIETRPGFYTFSDMPVYDSEILPCAIEIARNSISLPSYTMISDEDIDHVCDIFLQSINFKC